MTTSLEQPSFNGAASVGTRKYLQSAGFFSEEIKRCLPGARSGQVAGSDFREARDDNKKGEEDSRGMTAEG